MIKPCSQRKKNVLYSFALEQFHMKIFNYFFVKYVSCYLLFFKSHVNDDKFNVLRELEEVKFYNYGLKECGTSFNDQYSHYYIYPINCYLCVVFLVNHKNDQEDRIQFLHGYGRYTRKSIPVSI